MIKSSRVLPFRFKTAYGEIMSLPNSKESRTVLVALDKALNISVSNVPKFDGETLVVVDVSRSMRGKPSDIGSLFGSVLAKSNLCDMMIFSTTAEYVNYNPNDSVLSIKNTFQFTGGATNLKDVFIKANKAYDRIIILSDMQSFVGHKTPKDEFNMYKKKFSCDPYIYSWDLSGYSTLQFPENKIFAMSGFSEKSFDIIQLMEKDKMTLIQEVNNISI